MAVQFAAFDLDHRAFEYYAQLRRIKEYVEKNFFEELTLEKVARVAAMEATYFSAFFRQKVGITFRDWLREVRIGKAVELIQRENHSISDVAFAVGFSDLRTFERAFKKTLRMTPIAYKKSVLPENGNNHASSLKSTSSAA